MGHRIERVNQLIRREISDLLVRQVKDPRLGGFIAVTEVETSADLRSAKVFVSSIEPDADKQELLSVLSNASGFLHNELKERLELRRIPELTFHWDDSIERGERLLGLIEKVSAEGTS